MVIIATSEALVDRLWPVRGGTSYRELILILAGIGLLATASQVVIPVPMSPVPVTGQTLAVLVIGALYGSQRGAVTVISYIVTGILGAPVFALGGMGMARLAGPTGGYLVGFILAAIVTGVLAEQGWYKNAFTGLVAMLLGHIAVYLIGLPWLAVFTGVDKVLALGLMPFIIGDLAKVAVAGLLLPLGWWLLRK